MKIIGNTVGTTTPKPNLRQTDPKKGDFVKGKDAIPTKVSQLQNDSGFLNESKLSGAINTALAQAKASGEFNGEAGSTPVKGVDYFTEADKNELVEDVMERIPTTDLTEAVIPTFDLAEMGLPPIPVGYEALIQNVDVSAIKTALTEGVARIITTMSWGEYTFSFSSVVSGTYYPDLGAVCVNTQYVGYDSSREDPVVVFLGVVVVGENYILAAARESLTVSRIPNAEEASF